MNILPEDIHYKICEYSDRPTDQLSSEYILQEIINNFPEINLGRELILARLEPDLIKLSEDFKMIDRVISQYLKKFNANLEAHLRISFLILDGKPIVVIDRFSDDESNTILDMMNDAWIHTPSSHLSKPYFMNLGRYQQSVVMNILFSPNSFNIITYPLNRATGTYDEWKEGILLYYLVNKGSPFVLGRILNESICYMNQTILRDLFYCDESRTIEAIDELRKYPGVIPRILKFSKTMGQSIKEYRKSSVPIDAIFSWDLNLYPHISLYTPNLCAIYEDRSLIKEIYDAVTEKNMWVVNDILSYIGLLHERMREISRYRSLCRIPSYASLVIVEVLEQLYSLRVSSSLIHM